MAKAKTRNKAKPTKAGKTSFRISKKQKILLGAFLSFLGLALIIAFVSFLLNWQADQSTLGQLADRQVESQNLLNKFGATISDFFIYRGFGVASLSLAVLILITGIYLFFSLNKKDLQNYWFWGIPVMIWFSVFFGFFSESNSLLAGTIGFETNDYLQDYLGLVGTVLLLTFLLVAYLIARLRLTPDKMLGFFSRAKQEIRDDFKVPEETHGPTHKSAPRQTPEPPSEIKRDQLESVEIQLDAQMTQTTDQSEEIKPPVVKKEKITIKSEEDSDQIEMEVETSVEEEYVEDKSKRLVKDFGEFDPTLDLSKYTFPPVDLLKDYNANGAGITIDQEELEENKNRIVDTLKNYRIEIAQIKATVGPTVTLYEIIPEAGVRISKIKNLEDDIALSLSALGIRIIAPIPGKGTIGIEVPNKNSTIVSMRSVVNSPRFQKAEMELPMALGKTISNETFVVDLAKMPHLLMAGATGQGKSVGLNAILTSLLYSKHPAEVKFILVDPKKVELTLFNKIERHYLAKLPDSEEAIITDNTKVINTLNSLCIEMDNRYELLKNAMVRNIKEYNTKFRARKLNPEDGHRFLPYIVLVVDEFADLIMTAGKEVEAPIARLAQLARAIGIHLIIATQRPSVNVITGIIKANFPARIAFRVTSKIDSRTILDSQGADQLIGKGDMLFTQGSSLVRLQCAFVDTPEVEKITDYIGSQKAYPEAYLLPEYVGEESGTNLDNDVSERDKLFREAAEVVVLAQQGSASLLQRKLKLGYNRAGRIIDQLEAAGIVGPFEGSKARQVLVTDMAHLEQLLSE